MKNLQTICNLCGHDCFFVIEKDEMAFQVLKCDNCRLVFIHPHPDPDLIKKHYDSNYYSQWINQQKPKRVNMWRSRLKRINVLRPRGNILDVGCGEGLFLNLAKDSGWQISGTEISPYAAKFASKVLRTEVFCGHLKKASFADNSFDIVTIWHVLEHVEDPAGYLQEIHRVIKPDGLLVLAVPNVNALFMKLSYRILKGHKLKFFSLNDKEIHLYHFSSKTLRAYLKKTGFDCLRLFPDFGIVQHPKKIINFISVIPFYIAGLEFFNAIEIIATPSK